MTSQPTEGQGSREGGGAGQAAEEGLRRVDGEEVQAGGGREEHGAQLRVADEEAGEDAGRAEGHGDVDAG